MGQMEKEQPKTPGLERPWYYQNWFLIASFIMGWPIGPPFGVLWPVWSLLILRSPWHNHTLIKGLGWAMLVVGGVIFARAMTGEDGTAGRAVATLTPGLLVTVITQVMWTRFRLEHGLIIKSQPPSVPSSADEYLPKRSKRRRRAGRRRVSRPGRTSNE